MADITVTGITIIAAIDTEADTSIITGTDTTTAGATELNLEGMATTETKMTIKDTETIETEDTTGQVTGVMQQQYAITELYPHKEHVVTIDSKRN
ncbi:hypothetical protein YH65_05710 [Sulfurovum lithotrophicum]|uniref:Uncharacterized protein n=1 Tax=Sulfurovum lithotrophicum TaxID=206403 RepID=A0A7U4M141_9BACT|nr:hypothetical protein YH65_05710 [Sulfurovum lithotrophicum]